MAVEFFINLKFDCVATPFSYVGNAIVNGDFTICAGTGTIGNGLADHFWTSTPLGGHAWHIYFYNGRAFAHTTENKYYIRAVRSAE